MKPELISGRTGGMPLSGLRVLDLNGGVAPFCGHMLSMLGADVVLIEPSAEDCRSDVEWHAYNAGKRCISLEEATADSNTLRELVECSDVIVRAAWDQESLPQLPVAPGSACIDVVITPFGEGGPRGTWRGSELVIQSAGGLLYLSGERDFPPAMVGIPIASCAAGVQAAVATLLAVRQRGQSGAGAYIDVSIQEAVANLLFRAQSVAAVEKVADSRGPSLTPQGGIRKVLWPCADGYVVWNLWTGPGWGRKNVPLIQWMVEEGVGAELLDVPWEDLSLVDLDPKNLGDWHSIFEQFFLRFTKRRLFDEAINRRFLLYPVNDIDDVLADSHLASRDSFIPFELPGVTTLQALRGPFRSSAYDIKVQPVSIERDARAVVRSWSSSERQDIPRSARKKATHPPLDGVRVLDFSWVVAGPVTTKFLGMFGADVAKIESRRRPDAARMTGPYPTGRPAMNGSALFANHSACKRSLAVDMQKTGSRDLLLRLAEVSDVVVENFTPGVLERHRLAYEDLVAIKPDIIFLSMSLQGQTGLRATQPGLGNHLQALAGIDHLTGFPDGPPGGPNQMLPDLTGQSFGLVAILAALEHRRKTGEGQYIDLSQYEALLTFMQPALFAAQRSEGTPTRRGNFRGDACPHGVYPTLGQDRWLALGAFTDNQREALLSLAPDPVSDALRPLMSGNATESSAQVDAVIASWTVSQDGEALAGLLQRVGIAAYPVSDALTLLRDPQLVARKHYHWPEHPLIGAVPVDGPPFRLSDSGVHVFPAPIYGAASLDILEEWLGLSTDEIADLLADGILVPE